MQVDEEGCIARRGRGAENPMGKDEEAGVRRRDEYNAPDGGKW